MELPHDVLLLVRDFSQLVTRPDWRTLHRMTDDRFHRSIQDTYHRLDLPIFQWFYGYI
jgi:hypothetical protein